MFLKVEQSHTVQQRLTRNKEDSNFNFQEDTSKWRKKAWTLEEDEYLKKLVSKYGAQKWTVISENMPGRIGKQCRERWHNHLNPDINKEQWSLNEEWLLFLLHKNMGNQWAHFTRQLKGRTDNAIKNHWNSAMKKKAPQFMDRFKKAKSKFQFAKAGKQFDKYLMDQLLEDHRIPELEEIQNAEKSKIISDNLIKSEATIIRNKEEPHSFSDLQKTIKKSMCMESSRSKEQTATKSKRHCTHNYAFPIKSRLSQMSLFGGLPSKQNIVSAFSLLEESDSIVLEPQPSINELSLSINCIEELQVQNRVASSKSGSKEVLSEGMSLRLLPRGSGSRQRLSQTSLSHII